MYVFFVKFRPTITFSFACTFVTAKKQCTTAITSQSKSTRIASVTVETVDGDTDMTDAEENIRAKGTISPIAKRLHVYLMSM